MIKCVLLAWMILSTAFSGFSDERIQGIFVPSDGETSLADAAEALAEHPDMVRFIQAYPAYYGRDLAIDVTEDLLAADGGIPLFFQWDHRWGYRIYGSGFLAMTGCGPTCVSMVYCGLTGNAEWNPYAVAHMAERHGYYVPGVGTAWDLMTDGAQILGLEAWPVSIDSYSIVDTLQAGCPLIASMRPGDFTKKGHFIVLVGLDADGRVLVNDPNSRKNSETAWDADRLVMQMKGLWGYSY